MSATSGPTAPKPAAKALAGAASKSYNVASVWEKTAALSESQLRAVDTLSQACSQRPYPAHAVDDQRSTPETTEGHSKDSYVGTLEDAVLHNTSQFHKWHSELEAACASETEEKYKRYADLLNSHASACDTILGKVDATMEAFDMLLAQHRDVVLRSNSLHSSCEQLVREKDALAEFADALRAKLRFFDEFESVYAQFNAAQLSLDSEQLMGLLKRLDDCMAYVASNPQYADAGQYSAKFRQLQGRALGAVRAKVQQVLKAAVAQVQAAVQQAAHGGAAAAGLPSTGSLTGASNGGAPDTANGHAAPAPAALTPVSSGGGSGSSGAVPQLAEGAEVSLLYVRFRAAAEPQLKGLLREVETRSGRPEFARLLAECHQLYAAARLQLISPYVQQRLQQYSTQALPLFTRNACEHLIRVCQLEVQLFEQFFPPVAHQQQQQGAAPAPPPGPSPEALAPLLEPLATLLYDVVRPAVIMLQDLDELCELVDIFKHEVLGEQISRRGASGEALRPLLARCLADVQGRLIYRGQAYIKDEVSSYQVTPDDTDYPAKLQKAAAAAAAAGAANSGDADLGEDAAPSANGAGAGAQAPGGAGADPYAAMFPPLRSTLLVLSKLYRALDGKIFGGLAQDAVSACTASIQNASRTVARRAGPLDAQLFMIRNLLFLREQIVPFDVDFAVTELDLDFTHMREHLRRIMAGQENLFTFGASNAVVRMLGTSGPRVLTYQVDSKKELEKALKASCEAMIMALTKVAVEHMLSFITKVTAVRVAAMAAGGASGQAGKPLREQAFAAPSKVAEMVVRVNEALAGPLPAAVAKLRLYLPNGATHAVLLKPVKSNIAEAHGQIASLLQSEYLPEQAAEVPLKQPAELAALLDNL